MKQLAYTIGLATISGLVCLSAGLSSRMLVAQASNESSDAQVDSQFQDLVRKHFETRFFNKIAASEDQREKLSALLDKSFVETRPLREESRQDRLDLNKLLADDKVSDEQVLDKANEVKSIREKLMDERMETALAVRKILTPDQRRKVSDAIAERLTSSSSKGFFGT
jgi:Spy/CpxP family protein refolding chaperone